MSKTEQEKTLFRSFLKQEPTFAGEPIREWHHVSEWYEATGKPRPAPPDHDRPDIICATESARLEGVELKSWLDEEQIAEAKLREGVEGAIMKAIGEQPPNECRTISRVWLSPLGARMRPTDEERFRAELLSLIQELDRKRSGQPVHKREHGDRHQDFSAHPTLDRYLGGVHLHPRMPANDENVDRQVALARGSVRSRWITFPNRGGAYTPRWMMEALCRLLDRMTRGDAYKGLSSRIGLDRLHLLVHYDFNAFAYNTPAESSEYKFEDIVRDAIKHLGGDAGPFAAVYLLVYLGGDERAYRIL
jgi:hypothetical protein